MKMKRIIAREGLIIIGICSLLIVVFYMNSKEQAKRIAYESNAEIVEVVELIPTPQEQKKGDPADWQEVKPAGIYVMMQKPTDLIPMKQTLKKDFPKLNNPFFVALDHQPKQITVQHYYDNAGNPKKFTNYSFILLAVLFSYPAYLIIRFIIWATKVLKQKDF
jgi:hypothetical protein